MAIGILTYISFDTSRLRMEDGVSMNILADKVIPQSVAHDENTSRDRAAAAGFSDVYTCAVMTILKGRMSD